MKNGNEYRQKQIVMFENVKMPIQGNIVAPIILEMVIFKFLGFITIRQT